MRVIVILAIVHTAKENAYLLAVLLPVFSFFFSNHPSLIKTIILSGDLLLNIVVYVSLIKFNGNKFLLMIVSILVSKFTYYLIKYLLIQFSLMKGDLITTPLLIQLSIVIILSGYVYLIDKLSSKTRNV